ncbi:hypothetical protein PSYJA_34635 [Pseudomonas syringae pv. japonica str. M301072]|uniref:Uncharacterized protein n=1 Tax=Pseudomonas syringae pv. japonica str. M301072 TaxID=629262 RepID=F3FU82_PSESX|nr:hypothetical protein PSYJA_34635 [Pseudomonas syringae pv. japonica str. M301072]
MLTGLSQQPLVIAIQACQIVLFQGQRFLKLALLYLGFMELGLMSALILIPLFLHGLPVVLQGATRMNMLLLEGLDLFIPVTDQSFKISTALAEPGITSELGLKRGMGCLKVSGLSFNRCFLRTQLAAQSRKLRLHIGNLSLEPYPLQIKS